MKGILLGIRQHPWKAFIYFFTSFSVLWTIVEGSTHFIPTLELRGIGVLFIVIAVGLGYSAHRIRRPSSVSFNINHTNTKLEIKFSDIFVEDGVKAIAVNDFFDSEIGLPVSERSLHGIFLSKCFGGHPEVFDKVIREELASITCKTKKRNQGKDKRYPIGATALIPVNTDRYLCFALCRTDIATCKAEADIPTLWRALEGLYGKARNCLGGAPLVLPLVGSALAGVGVPARDLLDLIVLSVITESKQKQVTTLIKIILTSDRFEEIDLNDIKKYWR